MKAAIVFALVFALTTQARELQSASVLVETSSGLGNEFSPKYNLINTTGGVELREYEEATWAVAFGRSRWLTAFATFEAGRALAKYFKGGNKNGTHIEATTPVIGTYLWHGPHPHPHPHPPHKNDTEHPPEPPEHPHHHHHHHHRPSPPAVALAAVIPSHFKGKPPKPEAHNIKIVHTNSTKVYARSFGGWSFPWTIKREIRNILEVLKEQKVCPRKGRFFVAYYDSPLKLFNRTNEVWWAEKPARHHNSTETELSVDVWGTLGILDVESVFPEEFAEELGDEADFRDDPAADDEEDAAEDGEDAAEDNSEAVELIKAASNLGVSAGTEDRPVPS